ncbi:hypothetical protein SAMN05421755_10368 [Nitrosomonas sp. Nm33]|nr:hypothetical protein SAMN05421755_10368 [Nitrosomonas sp. Nm33]
MSQANAYEQYMLELINLNEAAENHNSWMIATDTFSHIS